MGGGSVTRAALLCAGAVLAALGAARAAYGDDVTVVRLQLAMEEDHTLQVDISIEYILQFVPSPQQSALPTRVSVRSEGGDAAHPLLVTARQRSGATTWQLPYSAGAQLLYELERTLCPDDASDSAASNCTDPSEQARRGEFSLHVGSSCVTPFSVTLRAQAAGAWRVPPPAEPPRALPTEASLAAPRVHYYPFEEHQDSVRLVVESDDDVCATVAVYGYSCPIPQTRDELEDVAVVRMTVLRSGGMQLSRARYPLGFYVIVAPSDTDEACTGEAEPADDSAWLWEAAVLPAAGAGAAPRAEPARRVKRLSLHMKESLSRGQYVAGALVTLAVFAAFYVAFGALVLAERWPRWHALVAPRAVLAQTGGLSELESAGDTAAARRRRRDSNATFDSSDNSDSDESEDGATTATATTAAGTPPLASPAPASPAPASPAPASPAPPESVTRADILDTEERPEATSQPAAAANGAARQAAGPAAGQAAGPAAGQDAGARPFGLPARLHVAALARRRGRVLRARSDRYLYTLYTVAVFYALPVVQFVAAFQMILNVSGSLDLCYYNFLCAHPLGALSDFNHVYSNLGYLLLGALFMLQLRRRRRRRKRSPTHEEYGIPQHYGLLSSLGAGLMVVALLSASYHVCPNRLNFQFDTAFMYVLAVLCMVKIYQSRHPDINARAHATFGVLAALIALVVWGVLGGGALFWSVFTVLHVFTFLLLSLRIYYLGQFRLEKESLAETARSLRAGAGRPLYTPRLVALLVANAVNWAFALYGLVTQSSDFASHLLFVLLCNTLLYIVFYLSMKLLHGERPRWYSWAYLAGAGGAWAPALYYFTSGSTDWSATPAESRHANHECRVLHFYDAHDLWHGLSALALYLTFNAMLTWDDGLSAVKRTEIAVF